MPFSFVMSVSHSCEPKNFRINCAQSRVCAMDPAAGCDTIGHVDNLPRLTDVAAPLVVFRESFLFDDLSVNSCYTVHLAGAHDGKVAHAN